MKAKSVNSFIGHLIEANLLTKEQAAPVVAAALLYDSQPRPKPPAVTAEIWSAYSKAYMGRYGIMPLDGPQARSQLSALLRSMSNDDAIGLVQYYLTRNDAFYAQARHPVGLCLRDKQKLHADWKTGTQVTQSQAQRGERYDTTVRSAQTYYARKHGS